MKMKAVVISFSLVVVVIVIGQWHWQNQINEMANDVQLDLERERNAGEDDLQQAVEKEVMQTHENERMLEIKAVFSTIFEADYVEYEAGMYELLQDAERVYVEEVLTGERSNHELVETYHQQFQEAQTTWSEAFWREYERLQHELIENGYFKEDAIEFELAYELRLEETTHLFVQGLMMVGQQIDTE